ncbi:MAG: LamG domain-containing protein [Propionivibrio sp.]|nr:LamG domain-containing protein [Propionivibrio sp.]
MKLAKLAGWLCLLALALLLEPRPALAVTYVNQSYPFAWIDSTGHTKVGYNTVPYKFNSVAGCGTTPPTLDDTLSDDIPLGFNFMYGGVVFSSARIMSNGRLQFGNTTCGFGSPVTQLPYPNASLNYTMRIYGNDLDHTAKSEVPAYTTVCLNRISCYVSYATLGTAPNRSFVVTWNNVPEWASGGSTSGNYNLQIILQENGEFIYQYGANTPGPGNATAQVGWQVDTNDYDIPAVGYPASNSAIKFYIPRPVAEYRMEQGSWNGTAGEVLDTSGNARHGTAIVAGAGLLPSDVATGKVCRGGQIADNATAANISAINSNVSIPTTVGAVGTIAFWYNNSSGDRMLFDASVANNQWFYLMRTGSRTLRFVVTDSGGTRRAVETAANAIPNAGWTHIAVTWNFNALAAANSDRLRIYVNGVLSNTSAFTTGNTLSASIGTLYLGDNRSSFIDATGPGTGASAGNPGGTNATLDEFRIYNYEGAVGLVLRDMNQAGSCLSHYAIATSGTPSVCSPALPVQVTVAAHDSGHSGVIMPNNTTQIALFISSTSVPGSLAAPRTNGGDWSLVSGYGTFDNGAANDGVATYIFNGEYQAVFSYQPSISGDVYAHATDGQTVESENALISVAGCVANFNGCETVAPQCVPAAPPALAYAALYTKLANTNFSQDGVALKSDGTLENTFAGSVAVDLLANINTGVAIGANNCPSTQDAVIALGSATFSGGRATLGAINVNKAYRDVRMRFTCAAAVCGSAITQCSSDNFAIRPQLFTLSTTTALNPASNKLAAGEDFNLTANPGVTVGYTGTPAVNTTLVKDHNAAVAGVLNGSFSAASGGNATGIFQYQDVGTITFNADAVTDASYTSVDQASGGCVAASTSNTASGGKFGCTVGSSVLGPLGRFYPHHFAVNASFVPACAGGFTYMDHDALATVLDVTAQSKSDATTTRYVTPASASVPLATLGLSLLNAASATDLLTRLSQPVVPARVWTAGVYTGSDTYRFDARNLATPVVDGPYDSLKWRVTITDATDGVQITKLNGAAVAAVSSVDSLGTRMRFGRLWLGNAYGSERSNLSLPYETQYWNGFSFVKNTLDSCTTLTAANFGIGNYQNAVSAGNLPATSITPGAFGSGAGTVTLAAPNAAGSADLVVRLNPALNMCPGWVPAYPAGVPATADYLRGKWCGAAYDKDPVARATFGINKTNRQIYLREGF